MNDLIAVNYESEQPTVSGRELHEALGVKDHYTDWFKRMCEYGFADGEDYIGFSEKSDKPTGGRPSTDHQLTIPMAKEICMLQRNDKGKEFRKYFIKIEEHWNSPEMVMKRALEFANKRVQELESKIEQDKPRVLFAQAVETAKTSILVGDLAKILKQNGVETGQKRLFERLRQDGFLIKDGQSRNMPTQRAMEMGLFEVKESTVSNPDGSIRVTKTTKVTGRGQGYFVNKYLQGGVMNAKGNQPLRARRHDTAQHNACGSGKRSALRF